MIKKLFAFAVLSSALVTTGVSNAWSQPPSSASVIIPVKYRYAVKFICGQAREPKPCKEYREGSSGEVNWICSEGAVPAAANGAQVVKGLYATAINVHNPNLQWKRGTEDGTVVFAKNAAFALQWQASGPVSPFERAMLKPNHAFEVDCEEIASMYVKSAPPGADTEPAFPIFLKGFLTIMSPTELDVTAVYTARGGNDDPAIQVNVIEPREQEGVVEAESLSKVPTD